VKEPLEFVLLCKWISQILSVGKMPGNHGQSKVVRETCIQHAPVASGCKPASLPQGGGQ